MKRVHRFGQVCALVAACGVTACGDTTRSSEADDATDGAEGSSSSSTAGGPGGASASAAGDTSSTGSGATDFGGTSTSSAATTAGGSGGSHGGGGSSSNGGSGGAGSGGAGGNGGWVPAEQTPGSFDCGTADITTPLLRMTNVEYDNTVFDLLGLETLDEFDGVRPSAVLADDPDDSISELGWEAYRDVALAIARQVMRGPLASNFITCEPTAAECLPDTITSFGRRAFRRPLTQDELSNYESLLPEDPTERSDETAQTLLSTMLTSPSFVWRPEQGGLTDPALTSYELASRLAYFLWGGPPDDALSAAAEAGELQTDEQLVAQALRLLDDPRSRRSFAEFHRGYLRMTDGFYWGTTQHDAQQYPLYSAEVNESALVELTAFLDDVVVSEGSFQDLFLSSVGFVNQHTAPLYGVAADDLGSELVRVQLDPTMRPGLLTRVAFLSSFSAYDSTSPILRGVFVNNEILNVAKVPPEPDILPGPLPEGDFATNRERVTALTSQAACADCHEVFVNPIGFVLENYDAIGAWQTVDPMGGPIDPVAGVFFGDEVETVENSLELMKKIAASRFAQRNYADEVIAYAFSRSSNARDACLGDTLAESIAQGISLQELWLELVRSDEFRVRGVPAD